LSGTNTTTPKFRAIDGFGESGDLMSLRDRLLDIMRQQILYCRGWDKGYNCHKTGDIGLVGGCGFSNAQR